MDEEGKLILSRIFLSGGRIEDGWFADEEELRNRLGGFGLMGLYEVQRKYDRDMDMAESQMELEAVRFKADGISGQIREMCRQALAAEGVDPELVLGGKVGEEEKKKMLLRQLGELGIGEQEAVRLGLEDLSVLSGEGRETRIYMEDTPHKRQVLEQEGIAYVREGDRLRISGRLEAREGVAYEDTAETRDFLDRNRIDYIRMANGQLIGGSWKKALFIPMNWRTAAYPFTNTQLANVMVKVALAAGAIAFNPMAGVIAVLVLRKSGLLKGIRWPQKEMSAAQRKALKAGYTVYKETERGAVYCYMDHGHLCRIDARDVPIPMTVGGVRLSASQRNSLRTGNIVRITTEKGEDISLRIDVTRPRGYREYVSDGRGREVETPAPKAGREEILSYVAERGYDGITEIYGGRKVNPGRDMSLARMGLLSEYKEAERNSGREHDAGLRREAGRLLEEERNRGRRRSDRGMEKIYKR